MSAIETRSPALPGYVIVMRRIKRAMMALAVLAVAAGLLASIDAIAELILKPSSLPTAAVKSSISLSGEIPEDQARVIHLNGRLSPTDIRVDVHPTPLQVAVDDFSISPRLIGSGLKWRASLIVLPPANPGVYQFRLSVERPDERVIPLATQDVDLYAAQSDLIEASSSACRRFLSINPLDAALASLLLAMLFGAGFFAARSAYAKLLMHHGCLRIHHAKSEGDDTLLYCLDPKHDMRPKEAYPVFSASGQLLGIADVLEINARWAVLRLTAARARSGCIVELRRA